MAKEDLQSDSSERTPPLLVPAREVQQALEGQRKVETPNNSELTPSGNTYNLSVLSDCMASSEDWQAEGAHG